MIYNSKMCLTATTAQQVHSSAAIEVVVI